MTATTVPVTMWYGCYDDSWQDLIVPEAFAHPAKFARGLIHRIYRHLIEQGYVRPGTVVLDPFGGVALGALDAMTYGLRWIGCELESRFCVLAQQNLDLWRQRYGFTGGTIVQGDSRRLREVLAGAQVQAVVGSPPYVGSVHDGNGIDASKLTGNRPGAHTQAAAEGYGTTPGQLGAMPPGALVSSPPYAGAGEVLGTHNGIDWSKAQEGGKVATPARQASGEGYGTSAGQLGAMPPGRLACVSSPPYEGSLGLGGHLLNPSTATSIHNHNGRSHTESHGVSEIYGDSPGQLGHTAGDTFWSASAQIMSELAALLPPGAVTAWVLKAYVSKGAMVPFPDQWRALCEAHGFVLVEEIHASLVEDHGTQHSLFGEAQRVTTEKKSFFRRLAEKKGSPRIDHETVLIVRKAGSGADVCCVSSPPYAGGCEQLGQIDWSKTHHGSREKAYGSGSAAGVEACPGYGTTPGNLGNLPVGSM